MEECPICHGDRHADPSGRCCDICNEPLSATTPTRRVKIRAHLTCLSPELQSAINLDDDATTGARAEVEP